MSPSLFFLLTLAVTVAALMLQVIARRLHRRALQKLAAEWKMHYSPDDRFCLANRVAQMLPVPGAALVRVADLIYGNEEAGYRYLFSAYFTEGVVRGKRRVVRVATLREPRERETVVSSFVLAPEGLSILEQYRELRRNAGARGKGQGAREENPPETKPEAGSEGRAASGK